MILKNMIKHSSSMTAAACAVAVGATALALGVGVAPANALSVYNDRTTWQNALGGGYTVVNEDFSDFIDDATSITFDDYPIVSTGSGGTDKFNGVGNDDRYSGGIKRGNPNGVGGQYFDFITWTFPETVKGFFFDYISMEKVVIEGDFNGNGTIEATERIRVKDIDGSTGSFGLIASTKFNQIKFAIDPGENNASENFKIENLAVAVPTPAVLPGLLGMGAAALRKRKQEEEAPETEEAKQPV